MKHRLPPLRCGFYITTPLDELHRACQMWATIAMHDALRKGPVCFCRLN